MNTENVEALVLKATSDDTLEFVRETLGADGKLTLDLLPSSMFLLDLMAGVYDDAIIRQEAADAADSYSVHQNAADMELIHDHFHELYKYTVLTITMTNGVEQYIYLPTEEL